MAHRVIYFYVSAVSRRGGNSVLVPSSCQQPWTRLSGWICFLSFSLSRVPFRIHAWHNPTCFAGIVLSPHTFNVLSLFPLTHCFYGLATISLWFTFTQSPFYFCISPFSHYFSSPLSLLFVFWGLWRWQHNLLFNFKTNLTSNSPLEFIVSVAVSEVYSFLQC